MPRRRPRVTAFLAAGSATLVLTDPPFNVNLGAHGGAQRGRTPIANDALDPEVWGAFVSAFARTIVDAAAGAIYVFMSAKEWPTLAAAMTKHGAHWSDTLIWAKDQFVLGRADYQHAYEPIWYGWPQGTKRHWCGDRDQRDVLEFPRPQRSEAHPTMKPVDLLVRLIENSSRPADVVFDPFLGSGSTLIACERTGRRCVGIELDPAYCDVIVERWEAFTGERAVRTPRPGRGGGARMTGRRCSQTTRAGSPLSRLRGARQRVLLPPRAGAPGRGGRGPPTRWAPPEEGASPRNHLRPR